MEKLKQYRIDGKIPDRLADIATLHDEARIAGDIPEAVAKALEDKLNAERPGVGIWQVISRGRSTRYILRLVR